MNILKRIKEQLKKEFPNKKIKFVKQQDFIGYGTNYEVFVDGKKTRATFTDNAEIFKMIFSVNADQKIIDSVVKVIKDEIIRNDIVEHLQDKVKRSKDSKFNLADDLTNF